MYQERTDYIIALGGWVAWRGYYRPIESLLLLVRGYSVCNQWANAYSRTGDARSRPSNAIFDNTDAERGLQKLGTYLAGGTLTQGDCLMREYSLLTRTPGFTTNGGTDPTRA